MPTDEGAAASAPAILQSDVQHRLEPTERIGFRTSWRILQMSKGLPNDNSRAIVTSICSCRVSKSGNF
jgi:hypothetical protein